MADGNPTGMLWAASQAADLRRLIVDHDLNLSEGGYSSGGFVGNSQINGTVQPGSQQQFLARNCAVKGGWPSAVWNTVFVGTEGAPASHCGKTDDGEPYTNVYNTPTVAEKPFVSVDDAGKYALNVPQVRFDSIGPDFLDPNAVTKKIMFEHVYVADAEKDTAASLNRALSDGLHLVLSPGIYELDASLEVNRANQVILGLGQATLIPTEGQPCITVGDVNGVRVAGVLLQAGVKPTPTLLRWGSSIEMFAGDASNPGVMSDVNARVGGPDVEEVQVEKMVEVNSSHVVGDNFWLWRADHDVSGKVMGGRNPVNIGMHVRGDNFTSYGLKCEHTLHDLALFEGERARTYFFQSEMPYDVDSSYAKNGHTGYRVAPNVKAHQAFGVGIYHFFRDHDVVVESGIVVPTALEGNFVNSVGVGLDGIGCVKHVINKEGGPSWPKEGPTYVP